MDENDFLKLKDRRGFLKKHGKRVFDKKGLDQKIITPCYISGSI